MPVHMTWNGDFYQPIFFRPMACMKKINPDPSRDPKEVIWCLECDEENCLMRSILCETKQRAEWAFNEPECAECKYNVEKDQGKYCRLLSTVVTWYGKKHLSPDFEAPEKQFIRDETTRACKFFRSENAEYIEWEWKPMLFDSRYWLTEEERRDIEKKYGKPYQRDAPLPDPKPEEVEE